jgi:hypothetical protein
VAKDVKIYDGSDWHSIKGPKGDDGAKGDAGVPGPTAVSADAGNVLEVGADSLLKLDPAKLDSRFVNVTGDTMTGQLRIEGPSSPNGLMHLVGETAAFTAESYSNTASSGAIYRARRARGTSAAPLAVQAGDRILGLSQAGARQDGTFRNAGLFALNVTDTPLPTDNALKTHWQLSAGNGLGTGVSVIAEFGIKGSFLNTEALGVNLLDPTHNLEVGGDTMLRGPLEVVGDITSTGTAHNFAADSILVSAVSGAVKKTGDTMTGPLKIEAPAAPNGWFQAVGDAASFTGESYSNTATSGAIYRSRRARGTASAPLAVQAGDRISSMSQMGQRGDGTWRNCGAILLDVLDTPAPTDNTIKTRWIIQAGNGSIVTPILVMEAGSSYFACPRVGIGSAVPTCQLDVLGDTALRGNVDVTGNITSTGTAHSFAAGSIPAPAVIGGTASTPTAGTVAAWGSMRWDENFLYIRTGTGWKKVALSAL